MSFLKPTFGIDLQLSGAVVADQFKMAGWQRSSRTIPIMASMATIVIAATMFGCFSVSMVGQKRAAAVP